MRVDTSTIKPSKNTSLVLHEDGHTEDIITSILWADGQPEHGADTKDFAPQFVRNDKVDSLRALWAYVRKEVEYVLDIKGEQNIKSPSRIHSDGFADCKGRSLFTTSVLKNLRIPYAYRFASYTGAYPVTHVYVLAKVNGTWYRMDPDMKAFNIEQFTTYVKDKDMTKINYLAGASDNVGCPSDNVSGKGKKKHAPNFHMHKHPAEMNNLDMEVAIRTHRHKINKHIIEHHKGQGHHTAEKVQDVIDAHEDIVDVMSDPNMSHKEVVHAVGHVIGMWHDGEYNISAVVSGIGDIGKKNAARHAAKAPRRAKIKHAAKSGEPKKKKGLFSKIKNAVKKVGKALVNVTKATMFAPIKIMLEASLPKAAPFFIYLFVRNQDIINKLPEQARKKRKTAEKIAKIITKTIGMKESHFMGLLRNGIMKRYHVSPERYLSDSLHMKIGGNAHVGIIDDIIKVILEILGFIGKIFKKKKGSKDGEDIDSIKSEINDMGADAAADVHKDFAETSEVEKQELGRAITRQPTLDYEKAASDPDYKASTTGTDSLDHTLDKESSAAADPNNPNLDHDAPAHPADEEGVPSVDSRNSKACSNNKHK